MSVENLKGSLVMTDLDNTGRQSLPEVALNGGRVRMAIDTVEVSADATTGSTYLLHRLPSNARIVPGSKVICDDLSTGATTLDVGIFGYKNNITNDDADALVADGDVATAGSFDMIPDIADWGKQLWDFVTSEETDPGGLVDIKATLAGAAASSGGTITSVVFYTID